MKDIPVFDRGHMPDRLMASTIIEANDDEPVGGRLRSDETPDEAKARRAEARARVAKRDLIAQARTSIIRRGIAIRQSCGKLVIPAHDNDNQDWPLAKFLRTEKRYAALMVAERYRALHNTASDDTLLVGKDLADNIFEMHRTDLDEATGKLKDKGPKIVNGKTDGEGQIKRSGKVVPKPFNGDSMIINRIDARREFAILRRKLDSVLTYFELAVVDRATLEEVGNARDIRGKKGAAGAGRVLVDIGLEIAARHWRIDLAMDGTAAAAA